MAKNDPRNIETTRTKALEWWRNLPILKRSELAGEYFTGRRQLDLTGRDIETIWNCNKAQAEQCNMPRIGQRYSIIENGERIFGTVESYQGDTGKFWVKWDDLEITLEEKCDAAL